MNAVNPYFWLRVMENVKSENFFHHCGKKNCPIHDVCLANELKDKSISDVNKAISFILYELEEEILNQL